LRSDGGNREKFFVSLITGTMGLMLVALWLLIAYGVVGR
jgi:hypothetical protein